MLLFLCPAVADTLAGGSRYLDGYIHRTYIAMGDIGFSWDPQKAVLNEAKHGVTFEEAVTAFSDEHGLLVDDPDHSTEEDRFILMGLSAELRLLVVVHCYRESESVIRIISARTANRIERHFYSKRNLHA